MDNNINQEKNNYNSSVRLSIIIPVYNCKPYVAQCMDSILCQMEESIEIICIDDCSTDDSLVLLKEYERKDSRVSVLHNTKNEGLSASRNRGIRNSKGDYIWFVDADDWIDVGAVNTILKHVNVNNPDILFFHSSYIDEASGDVVMWKDGFPVVYDQPLRGSVFFQTAIIDNGQLSSAVWLRCYRGTLIREKRLFFPEGIIHEDIAHSTETLLLADKVIMINETLYNHRLRRESLSLSSKEDSKRVDSFCFNLNKLYTIEQTTYEFETKRCLRLFLCGFIRMISKKMTIIDSVDRNAIDFKSTFFFEICGFGWYGGFFPFLLSPEHMKRIRQASRVVIFGAKSLAVHLFRLLGDRDISVNCFAISSSEIEKVNYDKLNICSIENIIPEEGVLLLIAAQKQSVQEMMKGYALELGFKEESILSYGEMIELYDRR